MNRTVAGRYEVLALLGSGGVAEVHQARDRQSGALVALKELLPQFTADGAVCRRFLREAEVARRLDHPGIVKVLDAGGDGRPYLVMELAEGGDLRSRLDRERSLPWSEALRIVLEIARGLEHAHGRGVVHRDLKPHNVLLGSEGQVKLADFGLARVQTLASLTGSSLVWGSPEYMAPELFGRGRTDPRSDLFSLGVLLFELATGRLPWKDRSLARLGASVRDGAGKLPSLGRGAGLDALVAALLASSPADRPSSIAEVVAVLEGRAAPLAPVRTVPCAGCGEPRPEDIPGCFACGHQEISLAHDPRGRWSVVLRSTKDDVDTMEALHQVLGRLSGRGDLRLKFLLGNEHLYSPKERNDAIKLPAVLFSQLDVATARVVEGALRARGLEAVVTGRRVIDVWNHRSARTALIGSGALALVLATVSHAHPGALLGGATLMAGVLGVWAVKLASLRGLFKLKRALPSRPGAERLLGGARQASATLAAPEVRALFVEVSSELYRLTRRAEDLAAAYPAGSSEEALARRLLAAAPTVSTRMEAIARRLETLDAALERDSDGDTMRALATLERRLAGEPSEELEAARRELEATLERRQAAEAERERLSAGLCRALGAVRDAYRRARTMVTIEEREAAAVTAALEALDAELR